MPYKNGRFIRGGNLKTVTPVEIAVTEEVRTPEQTEKIILDKIKNVKIEESKSEKDKGMKERLKKFVNLKI
jgi:hypothetical protein